MINDIQLSYVITRGSVPIFWSQTGKNTATKLYEETVIDRSAEMTKQPFRKHFKSMVDDYNEVHIIDLLKDEKERESRLTKMYYKLFYNS